MDAYLEQCKKFRKYSIDTKIVISDLGELQKLSKHLKRSNEHKYRANNWLKMHRKPMRRKPYKKECYFVIDEMHERFY